MINLLNTTGKRVRILRQDLGMDQKELSLELKKVGVDVGQTTVSRIERDVSDPGSSVIAAIAKVLGTTTDYLLLLTDDPLPPKESSDSFDLDDDVDRQLLRQLIDEFSALPREEQDLLVRIAETIRTSSKPRIIGAEEPD